MMMMAGVRRAGSTFTELLALLHVLHALKRFDLQIFVDFGFSGVSLKVLFISLPVTTKLFFTQTVMHGRADPERKGAGSRERRRGEVWRVGMGWAAHRKSLIFRCPSSFIFTSS